MSLHSANDTMRKFGHPDTVITETEHWTIQLRPQQVTLGSLVLISREPVADFGAVSQAGFSSLKPVVSKIEETLRALIDYQKINYLMLMMVDNDVHFHVFPRYEGSRSLCGLSVNDAGWPGPPKLDQSETPDADIAENLVGELRRHWSET